MAIFIQEIIPNITNNSFICMSVLTMINPKGTEIIPPININNIAMTKPVHLNRRKRFIKTVICIMAEKISYAVSYIIVPVLRNGRTSL